MLICAVLCCCAVVAGAQIVKPVKWSYAAKRVSASEVVLLLKADIDAGWHIYSAYQKEGGPEKTSFSFASGKSYSLLGKVSEPKPHAEFDKNFGIQVSSLSGSVVFRQRIKVKPGTFAVKGKVTFMACTDKQCLPPDELEFSIPVK